MDKRGMCRGGARHMLYFNMKTVSFLKITGYIRIRQIVFKRFSSLESLQLNGHNINAVFETFIYTFKIHRLVSFFTALNYIVSEFSNISI